MRIITDPEANPVFSEYIVANGFVFVSGQVAIDPRTGEPKVGDIRSETEITLNNLGSLLNAAGTELDHVVKCSVFLRNINDIADMNDVYVRYFSNRKPARTTTQAALIEPFNVEIDAVA